MEPKIKLANPATAEKYEVAIPEQSDVRIHIPAGKDRATDPGYAGPVSGLTPQAAAKYIAQGGNIIREKTAAVKSAVAKTETSSKPS